MGWPPRHNKFMSVKQLRKKLKDQTRPMPLPSYYNHGAFQALKKKTKVLRLMKNQDHTINLLASKQFWALLKANTSVSEIIINEITFTELHRLFLICYNKHITALHCLFSFGPYPVVLDRLMGWRYLTKLHLSTVQPPTVWKALARNTTILTLRLTMTTMIPSQLQALKIYLLTNKILQGFEFGATPSEKTCQMFASLLATTTSLQMFSCLVDDVSLGALTQWVVEGLICNHSLQKLYLESLDPLNCQPLATWLHMLKDHSTIRYFKYGDEAMAQVPDTLYKFQGRCLPVYYNVWLSMQWTMKKHHLYFEVYAQTAARDWASHHHLFYIILLCLGRQTIQFPIELHEHIFKFYLA